VEHDGLVMIDLKRKSLFKCSKDDFKLILAQTKGIQSCTMLPAQINPKRGVEHSERMVSGQRISLTTFHAEYLTSR